MHGFKATESIAAERACVAAEGKSSQADACVCFVCSHDPICTCISQADSSSMLRLQRGIVRQVQELEQTVGSFLGDQQLLDIQL